MLNTQLLNPFKRSPFHRAIAGQCRSFGLFSEKPSNSSEKAKTTGDRFLIIPNNNLHPDIQQLASKITGQQKSIVAGLLFYPSLATLGHTSILLYTPVCVGFHSFAIRCVYLEGYKKLNSGDKIVNDPIFNDKLREEIIKKIIFGFHINYQGDLVFHRGQPSNHSLSSFKGISLLKEHKSNPFLYRINSIRDQIFSTPNSQISYFHLQEDVQKEVDKVLVARQLRFRAYMLSGLATSIFGTRSNLLGSISDSPPLCFLSGLMLASFLQQSLELGVQMDDLWKLMSEKKASKTIIHPKYAYLYPNFNDDSEKYICVNIFGNIEFRNDKSFLLRSGHLL